MSPLTDPRKILLWDLDGTLVDTQLDLATSVNWMLREYGYTKLPVENVSHHIGRGARNLVARSLEERGHPPLTSDEVDRALAVFQRHYAEHLLDHSAPYDGIRVLLETLTARGRTMAVVTNKPEHFSREILTGLDLLKCFRTLVGDSTTPYRKPDPRPLLHALALCDPNAIPADAIMIGDSEIDVLAARNAGIAVVGCGWGLGPLGALREAGPDWFFAEPSELAAGLVG